MNSETPVVASNALKGTPLDEARAGLDACVHCGFCMQACPTYLALDDENDSPRGRLFLMRSLLEGALPADDADARKHIDQCLGCRACETVCPSGVPYGHLLEATRETLTKQKPIPFVGRLMLAVFARPWLMRLAMSAGAVTRALRLSTVFSALLPGRARAAMRMLEATRPALGAASYSALGDGSRGTVAVLEGCVMDGLYAPTNAATERTLTVNGYRCTKAAGQACCGALHAHAGDADTARMMAKRNIAAFERSGTQFIASNAAGCGAMLKEYGQLLAHEPEWVDRAAKISSRVRDVTELLAAAGPVAGGKLELRVAYDAPCHLLHAQRISAPPLKVLAAIPGLTIVPLTDSDRCCGAAGIYNLLEPATSEAVLEPKLAHIADAKVDIVATGNPGCLMQIGAGLRKEGSATRVAHPVDLLDASYAARG